jgi:DNA invertase Pin-like site-specific DNA recombinase
MKALNNLPKSIEYNDMLLYLQITYNPLNRIWEVAYNDIMSSLKGWRLSYGNDLTDCIKNMAYKMNDFKNGLKKVSTYAKEKDVSVQTVYKWIEKGELQCVSIDNVKFVKV